MSEMLEQFRLTKGRDTHGTLAHDIFVKPLATFHHVANCTK